MVRKKSKMSSSMRMGQTIVAEREQAESESERMLARKKAHRKKKTSVLIVILMMAILVLAGFLWMREWGMEQLAGGMVEEEYQIKAQVIDEDGQGQISARVRTYIGQLEQDLQDLGYTVTKVTLPTGMSRELYVDLEGKDGYYKVSSDRGAGVTAEDIDRMVRYLAERDIHPEYIDVRVEGKAYYK